jgi:hypothetical protein
MTDSFRKKALQPFVRATAPRTLVAARGAVALPTAALLQVLLAACGGRGDVDVTIRSDETARAKPATTSSATNTTVTTTPSATIASTASTTEPLTKPMMGAATDIEQTIVLSSPPPPPPPKPKALLGKPHGIKPPAVPFPLGGDMMMVIPRPLGTGAKPI